MAAMFPTYGEDWDGTPILIGVDVYFDSAEEEDAYTPLMEALGFTRISPSDNDLSALWCDDCGEYH